MPSNMSLSAYTAGSAIRQTIVDAPSYDDMDNTNDLPLSPELQETIPVPSPKSANLSPKLKDSKDEQAVQEVDSSSELSEPPSEISPPPSIPKSAALSASTTANSPVSTANEKTLDALVRTRAGRIVGRKRSPQPVPPKSNPGVKTRAGLRSSNANAAKPTGVTKHKSAKLQQPWTLKPVFLFLAPPSSPPISPITPLRDAMPYPKVPLLDSFYYCPDAVPREEMVFPSTFNSAVDSSVDLANGLFPNRTSRLLVSGDATRCLISCTERAARVMNEIAARKPHMALRELPFPPATWNSVERNGKLGFFKPAVRVEHVGAVDGDYFLGALLREYDYRLREVEAMVFVNVGGVVEFWFLEEIISRLEWYLGLPKWCLI